MGETGPNMLHKTSRERYDKLKRVFRRLMRNFNLDDLDDFIATANSMPVWMENDPSLAQEQRDALARFTVDERQSQINPGGRGILLQSTRSARVIGAGEEISVDYSGTQESALAFVIRTFKHFHSMFDLSTLRCVPRGSSARLEAERIATPFS